MEIEEGTDQPLEGDLPPEQPPEYSFTSFGNQIYEKVPEDIRPQVAEYLKEFDTGFVKYSQEVQPKLKAYESYGSPEEIGVASQLYNTLLNQPQVIYDYLVDIGVAPKQAAQMAKEASSENAESNVSPEYQAMQTKLSDMEKIVTALGAHIQQQRQTEEDERNRAQFNILLDDLENQHGKFDRMLVTRLIAGGASPEEAVTALKGLGQQAVNSAAKLPPPVLSGSGASPRTQMDLTNASRDDTKSFMANAIAEIIRNNK